MAKNVAAGTTVKAKAVTEVDKKPECFVIMPMRAIAGRDPNHFERVYKYLFLPACEKAGFVANSPFEEAHTHLIHEKIIRRLVESPMVLCDISTHNPNVLFELGLRQAFDKPVTIVKEKDTERLFDISGLLDKDYDKLLAPWTLEEDIPRIANTLRQTWDAVNDPTTANSLMSLLKITMAPIPELGEGTKSSLARVILSELSDIREQLGKARNRLDRPTVYTNTTPTELGDVLYERLINLNIPHPDALEFRQNILADIPDGYLLHDVKEVFKSFLEMDDITLLKLAGPSSP
ncbi:MAG TPA: hypothetical protein VHV55_20710 [Pirellulales bacterium]|jgi:hypothetical protein|nr:hypothetical protein [Pirellulales bacterium]